MSGRRTSIETELESHIQSLNFRYAASMRTIKPTIISTVCRNAFDPEAGCWASVTVPSGRGTDRPAAAFGAPRRQNSEHRGH